MSEWIFEAGYPVLIFLIGWVMGYLVGFAQDRRKG